MDNSISGYGEGWLMGIRSTEKYPDRTMSEKEWKKINSFAQSSSPLRKKKTR